MFFRGFRGHNIRHHQIDALLVRLQWNGIRKIRSHSIPPARANLLQRQFLDQHTGACGYPLEQFNDLGIAHFHAAMR